MPRLGYEDLAGAIYDVDDTLLNNHPQDGILYNLHERSRLAALHAIGQELGYHALLKITDEENEAAFLDAPVHTTDAAIWLLLHRYGVVDQPQLVPDHPTLTAVVERKAQLHMDLLLTHGEEVTGASDFVFGFEGNGTKGRQAVASGARLEEIQTFFSKYGLTSVIPRQRIVARGDYVHSKPHPEPFDKAFLTLGLEDTPEIRRRTLAVEDDPKGYLSARAAGLYACVVTTRFPADAFLTSGQRPERIASNMAELGEQLGVPMSGN